MFRAIFAVGLTALIAVSSPHDIAKAVRELGSDDFATREKATAYLWSVGQPAEPALRQALNSPDSEVVARARDLLDKIPFGITPDSPKKYVTLVARARAASADAWPAIVVEMFEDGPDSLDIARQIAGKQDDPARRKLLLRGIDRESWRLAPRLLAAGKTGAAEELLRRSVIATAGEMNFRVLRNYAAFLRVNGALVNSRGHWDKWAVGPIGTDGLVADQTPDGPSAILVSAFLAKAAGDFARARILAQPNENNELTEMTLFDAQRWAELAEFVPTDSAGNRLRLAANKATFLRLAGKSGEATAARAQFDAVAEETKTNRFDARLAFRAMMYDLRISEALSFAEKSSVSDVVVSRAEIVSQRGQPRAGIEFLQKTMPAAGTDRMEFQAALTRLLYHVGDREALDMLVAAMKREKYANSTEHAQGADFVEQLVSFGLYPAAADHTAALLAGNYSPAEAFGKMCPNAPLAAEAWYAYLTRDPGTEASEVLQRIFSLTDERLGDNIAELEKAVTWAKSRSPAEREKLLRGFGEAFQRISKTERAAELYQLAAETSPGATFLKLGDMYAEVGKWPGAAAAYERAGQVEPRSALALFLAGFAKQKAGDASGIQLQLTARLMLQGPPPVRAELTAADKIADERDRQSFCEELIKRSSFGDEIVATVRAERQLLVDLSHPSSSAARTMLSLTCSDAGAFQDRLASARANQMFLLRMIRTNAYFKRNDGYLSVIHRMGAERARGLLANGDVTGAVAAANEAHDVLPTATALAVNFVPELSKAGAAQQANEFYAKVALVLDRLIRDYPKSAAYLNSRAWLAVRCRREPELALAWAKRAVELAPENLSHAETLAEAHFQNKQADAARAHLKRIQTKSPTNVQIPKLLKRIDAGDPAAPMPEK